MRLVFVMRFAESIPDDVGHVFDQLSNFLETFLIDVRRRLSRVGQKVDVAKSSNDSVELFEKTFDGAPVQWGLQCHVGWSCINLLRLFGL